MDQDPVKTLQRALHELTTAQAEVLKLEEIPEYRDSTALFRIGRAISDAHTLVSDVAIWLLNKQDHPAAKASEG